MLIKNDSSIESFPLFIKESKKNFNQLGEIKLIDGK